MAKESKDTLEIGTTAAVEFLRHSARAAASLPKGNRQGLKLIMPCAPGSLIRSDIVSMRLVDCPQVKSVVDFSKPRQWFEGHEWGCDGIEKLEELAAGSVAGILLESVEGAAEAGPRLDALEVELRNRLSIPLFVNRPPSSPTLALVKGPRYPQERRRTGSNIATAADALGIKVIILDGPEHWLNESKYSNLYEAFLPIDVTRDDHLPQRIVDALAKSGRRIDGVSSLRSPYTPYAAAAAEMLGLPTTPPRGLRIATDKFETSIMSGHLAYKVSSEEEISILTKTTGIRYPLVLKPCVGANSEGVSLANNQSELTKAFEIVSSSSYGACVEEYCDGPELDVNVVLWKGEFLFYEVSDDFPKSGDGNTACRGFGFVEYANVLPSKLPNSELDMLRKSLHATLSDLGFRDGVVHLEARIKNSRMIYATRNGLMDLEDRTESCSDAPSSWLIEINARQPGKPESDAVESTYGIDYIGLALLLPLQDEERIKALSQPFANGPQYWCQMVFIQVERGGIFRSDDVCEELKLRRPDLAKHITKSCCFLRKGDEVPDPKTGMTAWVGYIDIFSRVSRRHVLEIGEIIRKEVRYSIE